MKHYTRTPIARDESAPGDKRATALPKRKRVVGRPRHRSLRRRHRRQSGRNVAELPVGRYRMNAVVADTHSIVWYLANDPRLSPAAIVALDQATASVPLPSGPARSRGRRRTIAHRSHRNPGSTRSYRRRHRSCLAGSSRHSRRNDSRFAPAHYLVGNTTHQLPITCARRLETPNKYASARPQ